MVTKQVTVFPDPDEFAKWVRRSIADLGMYPGNFLLDPQVPGSRNRVALIIKQPHRLRLAVARRLHREIVETAHAQGVELLPLPLDVLETRPMTRSPEASIVDRTAGSALASAPGSDDAVAAASSEPFSTAHPSLSFPQAEMGGRAAPPATTHGPRGLKYIALRALPYVTDIIACAALFAFLIVSLFIGAAVQ